MNMYTILHENPFSGSITIDPNSIGKVAGALGKNIANDSDLITNYATGDNISAAKNLISRGNESANQQLYDAFMGEAGKVLTSIKEFLVNIGVWVSDKFASIWNYIKSFFGGAPSVTPQSMTDELVNKGNTYGGASGIDVSSFNLNNLLSTNNRNILIGIFIVLTSITFFWKIAKKYINRNKNNVNINESQYVINETMLMMDMSMMKAVQNINFAHNMGGAMLLNNIEQMSNNLANDSSFMEYASNISSTFVDMLKSFIGLSENTLSEEKTLNDKKVIPVISLKNRVDAIIKNSTAYAYYLNTPLNELKTRDEKLIKQELERRQLMMLNEGSLGDKSHMLGNALDTVQSGASSFKNFITGAGQTLNNVADKIQTQANLNNPHILSGDEHGPSPTMLDEMGATRLYYKIINYLKEWVDWIIENISAASQWVSNMWRTMWLKISAYFRPDRDFQTELSGRTPTSAVNQYVSGDGGIIDAGPGVDPDAAFNVQGPGGTVTAGVGNTFNNIMSSDAAKIGIGVLLAITALVAIWKIVKHYIKDDGTPTNTPESSSTETNQLTGEEVPTSDEENPTSESYNPMYNNVALAILEATNTEDDEEKATEIATGEAPAARNPGILASFANKMVINLIDDPKFCEHMKRTKPELLEALKQYISNPIQESVNLGSYGMMSLIENNMKKKR